MRVPPATSGSITQQVRPVGPGAQVRTVLSELARTRVPTPAVPDASVPSLDRLLPAAWQRLPQAVLRALAELPSDDPSAGALLGLKAGLTGGTAIRPAGAPVTPYNEGSRESSQVRAMSHLLRRIDTGAITAAQLNEFLSVACIAPEVMRRSIAELGLDPRNLALNGAIYLLRHGWIVPADQSSSPLSLTAENCYRAAALALLLGLVVLALVRSW